MGNVCGKFPTQQLALALLGHIDKQQYAAFHLAAAHDRIRGHLEVAAVDFQRRFPMLALQQAVHRLAERLAAVEHQHIFPVAADVLLHLWRYP